MNARRLALRLAAGLVLAAAVVVATVPSTVPAAGASTQPSHHKHHKHHKPKIQVVGTWTINWQWAGGSGGSAPITFSSDHHFSVTSESGTWSRHGKTLTFRFTSTNSCHGTWVGTYRHTATTREFAGTMSHPCTPITHGTWNMSRPVT